MERASRCPICGREIPLREGGVGHGRFCSARCKSIDLGAWLEGRYRISEPLDEDAENQGETVDKEHDPDP